MGQLGGIRFPSVMIIRLLQNEPRHRVGLGRTLLEARSRVSLPGPGRVPLT